MFLFAWTIFTSAFLLFLVQPVIAKKILPWFGGSAAVWTTCMLFFQVLLLLGYLYSHWSIRYLKPKRQVMVHLVLLALSLVVLPLAPNPAWRITGAQDPAIYMLAVLATSVGLPYFLLSTTGPLLQAWYARRYQGSVPYRLYALSNLGSMLALLGYPTLMEPFVWTHMQLWIWSAGYALFVVLCAAVAWKARSVEAVPSMEVSEPVAWRSKLLWVALAACSSALLLAITNHLCQDVAAMPFLWVLPLALYLLSFVICFESEGWYSRIVFLPLLVVALGMMAYDIGDTDRFGFRWSIPVLALGLFACCMFCHGELAARKPAASQLTSFYLMISLGGALGAMFVALAAPRIFVTFYELPIGLAACGILAAVMAQGSWKLRVPWVVFALALTGYLVHDARELTASSHMAVRNFYGGLRVEDETDDTKYGPERKLLHGSINHGLQFQTAEFRRIPTTYYGKKSGVGLAILNTRREGQRVGVVGLGTGTLAAYGRQGDYYRFYEINPLVVKVARTEFTYLRDTPAKVEVALGDARLSLEREASQQFDVLAVDAFSGDSIPVHLLTRESFDIYFRHLRPGGVLAVHVSNRYLSLEPVVQMLADATHHQAALFDTDDGDYEVFEATWVLVTDNQEFLNNADVKAGRTEITRRPDLRQWTDDYSNLFQIVKWE